MAAVSSELSPPCPRRDESLNPRRRLWHITKMVAEDEKRHADKAKGD